MIKTTRWSPDTCDCVIDYEWDSELSNELVIHTPVRLDKTCPAHGGLEVEAAFASIKSENSSKNLAVGYIKKNNLSSAPEKIVTQLVGSKGTRVIELELVADKLAKLEIQAWCDATLNCKVLVK